MYIHMLALTNIYLKERAVRETIHNSRDTTTVSLPHWPEPPLSPKVPKLYCDISLSHFSHVEPNLRLTPRIIFQLQRQTCSQSSNMQQFKIQSKSKARYTQLESCPHCSPQSAGKQNQIPMSITVILELNFRVSKLSKKLQRSSSSNSQQLHWQEKSCQHSEGQQVKVPSPV